MAFRSSVYAIVALGFFPLAGGAAEKWSQLKIGMSADEALATLGPPLARSAGRGFQTWTYDKGGDVLIFGTVVGWTAPVSAKVAVRSKDVWSENRDGTYLTFYSLLPPRVPLSLRRDHAEPYRKQLFIFTSDYYRQ